jgi:hypothetical protein
MARRTNKLSPRAPGDDTAAPRRRTWDALAAVVASLVGFLAVVFSGYTAYIMRQQVRAQVWPWLVAGNDDIDHSIIVYNKGAGPAIVTTAQVFVDGKPQRSWNEVLDALGIAKPREFLQSTINPNVLTPGEKVTMIRFPDKEVWQRFRTAAVDHVTMDICFCSTLGECWMYSDRHPVGYKLTTQLVKSIGQCPSLPDAEVFKN